MGLLADTLVKQEHTRVLMAEFFIFVVQDK
jgi:hypothetical protein